MSRISSLEQKRLRVLRNSSRLRGDQERPRLSVTVTNKNVHAQVIDDSQGVTIVGVTKPKQKIDEASVAIIAALKKNKVTKLVCDRRHKQYSGNVAKLVDGLRKEGIEV